MSQDVKKTHEFAVEAAGCRHNQREKGLVVVTEVVRTVCVALRLRHSRVNEHLVGVGVARLTVAGRVGDIALKSATSMMRSGVPATFKPCCLSRKFKTK